MQMDEGLDTGDVLFKVATPVGPGETAGSLHDRLAQLAPNALLACLDLLGRSAMSRERQDGALATYAPKLTRKDGEIDWTSRRGNRKASPRHDAVAGRLHFCHSAGYPVILKIHRAEVFERGGEPAGTVVAANDHGVLVAAGEGGILLKELQIAGGKRLTAAEFLRGHPIAPGVHLGKTE